jgi:predicted nucleic acid-binding protein
MDKEAGRRQARRRNIRVTGTPGVLRVAAVRQMIDVPSVLTRLRDSNFYFDENLIRRMFAPWMAE